MSNVHFFFNLGDLIALIAVPIICICLLVWAWIDVYILTPYKKAKEEKRRRAKRGW
ncbi:TPA: hypothetical protein I9Y37_001837 [Citrobacter freundii]|nr:hypothetical protein [Citrobacter freundii]HAT3963815.1 hypothetical protein [Citrobacter freundii]